MGLILGALDDVMAFAASVVTILPLGQGQEIWDSVLEGKGCPIGLLLAAQGSGFIQALQAFGGTSAGK